MLEHDAYLVLAAFDEPHFVPRIRALAQNTQAGGSGSLAMHGDTAPELLFLFLCETAVHLDQISLRDVAGGRSEPIRELAVIGQQEEPFTGVIEASDRVHTLSQ